MEELLYVVQWTDPDGEPTSIGPEIEDVREIIASDVDWLLVRSYDLGTLERIVSRYPGWTLSGQPANGKFVDIGGDEVEVKHGYLVQEY
jgi:hypothetical protein